ncbi:hypothetical protein NDU88_000891 [Pleurodeles waltl]|uniref:Uncharacterized protein n=1 Tax=Pleurodeles waltl TaxID=8319 RepID=A0AAV7L7W3_PLEWA|nr:hypothetical protein NDU88_000891 [Pleurodeles waltl]
MQIDVPRGHDETMKRGTPNVFPGGTAGRILSWDTGDFRGCDLKNLPSPEEAGEENTERGDRDVLSLWKSEVDTPTALRGEDVGPSFQEPRKRHGDRARRKSTGV